MAKSKYSKVNKRDVAKIAKQIIYKNSETKCFSSLNSGNATSALQGYVFPQVSQIAEGVGPNDRQGNNINPIRLVTKCLIQNVSVTPIAYTVLVVRAANAGFLSPTTSEWLLNPAGDGVTLTSERQFDVQQRRNTNFYKIVHEKSGVLGGHGSSYVSGKPTTAMFSMSKKLSGTRKFDTAAAADTQNDNIRVLLFIRSTDAAFTARPVDFYIETNYYYKDI